VITSSNELPDSGIPSTTGPSPSEPLSRKQKNASLAALDDEITPVDGPSPIPGQAFKQKEISPRDSVSRTSPSDTLGIRHADSTPASSKGSKEEQQQKSRISLNSPFAFTPQELTQLNTPKDLSVLRDMGGVAGLILGLQTNENSGLSPTETVVRKKITRDYVRLAIQEQQTTQNEVSKPKEIDDDPLKEFQSVVYHHKTMDDLRLRLSVETENPPTSIRRRSMTFKSHPDDQIFKDRHRIFSENHIPLRKKKNVFQLMWSVLHDKVLVRPLYLGFLWIDSTMRRCSHLPWFGILSKLSTWRNR
jgi:hypothetical protein